MLILYLKVGVGREGDRGVSTGERGQARLWHWCTLQVGTAARAGPSGGRREEQPEQVRKRSLVTSRSPARDFENCVKHMQHFGEIFHLCLFFQSLKRIHLSIVFGIRF